MISPDIPNAPSPLFWRKSSLSAPERLALARFIGLPMTSSLAPGWYEALLSNGGRIPSKPAALGGVDPAVGVLEAGDLRVTDPALRGSNECWRFSCMQLEALLSAGGTSCYNDTHLDLLHPRCQLTLLLDILGRKCVFRRVL